jgi:hypothetical protein
MGNDFDSFDSSNSEIPRKGEEKNLENIEKENNNNETEEILKEQCLKEKIQSHCLSIQKNDKNKDEKKNENNLIIVGGDINDKNNCNLENNELYNESIVTIINKIRDNPRDYAKEIEKNMTFIKKFAKDCFIFDKNNIKIALFKGKDAFIKSKEALESMKHSIPKLEIKEELKIQIPNNINELNDDLKNQKFVCFKDYINIPEISILLMIVDDTIENTYERRNIILNKDYKYIGINSKIIDKQFVSVFSFSKDDI